MADSIIFISTYGRGSCGLELYERIVRVFSDHNTGGSNSIPKNDNTQTNRIWSDLVVSSVHITINYVIGLYRLGSFTNQLLRNDANCALKRVLDIQERHERGRDSLWQCNIEKHLNERNLSVVYGLYHLTLLLEKLTQTERIIEVYFGRMGTISK